MDSPLESLFTYQPGESWVTFYDPHFIPVYTPTFSSTTLEQQANTLCGDDAECLFDIAATDRVDIGQVAVDSGQEIDEILQLQIPSNYITIGVYIRINTYLAVVCQDMCVFGACVANDTCLCEPGYNGSNCSTPGSYIASYTSAFSCLFANNYFLF